MERSDERPSSQFGVCVAMITAKLGDKENAMPATWTIPVSFSPKLVAINIGLQRYTHEMIRDSKKFAINLLAEDQVGLARYAGSHSGSDTDKFKEIPKFYGELDIPLVEGCVASLECKVVDQVKEGDHTVFTGEVANLYTTDKKPLLMFRGEYFKLGESLGSY